MLPYASHFDPIVVARSIAIAVFASFVALDLAKRMQSSDRTLARRWWVGGSVVLGTGIWSMHFLGMLAFSLPIAIGYTPGLTVVSWCAATAVSAVALTVASAPQLPRRRLAIAATTMGAGIFAMHYLGMAAIDMAPGIVWSPSLVAASFAIAVAASAAALQISFWLRTTSGARGVVFQLLAALVMGLAISGMHYTGMAAASFPAGSICLSADSLGGGVLQRIVSGSTVVLLVITLLASSFDARMQSRGTRIAASLREANVALEREHERFRALTAMSSDWFWEQDLQGRVTTLVNSVALTAGLAREEYLGKTIMELGWRPVDADGWPRFRDDLIHHRPFQDWELQRADSEGRMHFISNSGAPMFDAAGAFTGYRGVGRDITLRKRDERRNLLQHRATRLLADSTAVHGTLPELIGAICTTCHWQGGMFLAAADHDVPGDSEFWAEPGAEATFEHLVDCIDGPERSLRAAAAGLRNAFSCQVRAGEQVLGELEFRFRAPLDDATIFFDVLRGIGLQLGDFITRCNADARLRGERELLAQRVAERTAELSRSNRDLETARVRAEDASRAKSAFLATMSHEIRTPMNGVVGMIEILEQGKLDAEQRDAVRTIRTSSFSLLSLIDDILEFTRDESGRAFVDGAAVNLADIVEGACNTFAAEADAKHVEMSVFVSRQLPQDVLVDGARLSQALRKLLSNAIKFSTGRAVAGRVSVRAEASAEEPDRLVIKVTDNGIGMDGTAIGNLFVPFSQAEATTTRRYGGAGLGLVVCRRMVEAMQGEITVSSEPGAGSVFTITVPIRSAPTQTGSRSIRVARATRAMAPEAIAGEALPERPDAPSVAQARADGRLILVAEDDLVNQKVVMKQLALLGYSAELAGDGAEALHLWTQGRHALILSDLHMPELDGYGLALAVRAEEAKAPHGTRVPILALTADATAEATVRIRDAGMDEHLTKPIQLAVLGRSMQRWLPHRHATVAGDMPLVEDTPSRAGAPGGPVDVSVLKGLVGDDPETLREFLAEYLQCARAQGAEIVEACASEDVQRAGSVAHKLKASSRSVGAMALGDLCAEIESAGRSGSRAELVERCQRFEREMQHVDACIVEALGLALA